MKPYEDYIFYVGRIPYQLWQLERIAKRLGGTPILPGYQGEIGGICLFANQIQESRPNTKLLRVYVAHGTSNKPCTMWFGDRGKDIYDYYWTTGPKMRKIFEQFGHGIKGKEIKIGNLRFDWYFNDYSHSRVMDLLKIKNNLPLLIFAPTFKKQTLEHCNETFKPLLEKYNVVIKPHPIEKVNQFRKHHRLQVYEGDISNILWAADVLISDESSVAYDFTITGKPIVLCPPIASTSFDDEDKYNLEKHTASFEYWDEKADIMESIEEARARVDEVKQLCKDSFWYQDGYATDRACDWIRKIIDERFINGKKKE